MALALSTWWYVGWVIAAVVVVIAATLLLAIIFLGRRVTRQADDITVALDGTRANTARSGTSSRSTSTSTGSLGGWPPEKGLGG